MPGLFSALSAMRSSMIRLCVGLLLCVMVSPAVAQDINIAFVNWSRLTNEAPQADSALRALEAEFGPRDQQLAAEMADLHELERRLARDGALMSEDDQRLLQRDVVARKRDLRRAEEEFREDFNLRRNEELNQLHRLVIDAVGRVARRDDLDLVITDGVVFASDRIDLTDAVLRELERQQ